MKCEILKKVVITGVNRFLPEKPWYTIILTLDTPYGHVTHPYQTFNLEDAPEVGGLFHYTHVSVTGRLINRLKRLGIDVEFVSSVPWVYLNKVNGVKVNDNFQAEHGFCIGMMRRGEDLKWSCIKTVFNKIREML